jgi:hypothetical protein
MKVVATSGDQQQAVVAQFQPDPGVDLYKRLITATDYLIINRNTPKTTQNRLQQLRLYGQIATGAIVDEDGKAYSDLSEIPGYLTNWCGGPTNMNGLPTPDHDVNKTSEWWNTHWTASTNLLSPGTDVSFSASGAPYRVFRTEGIQKLSGHDWTIASASKSNSLQHITVTGTCMWMLEQGLFTGSQVAITSGDGAPATLILVAGYDTYMPGKLEDGVGWAFQGGIKLGPNVRLFIVSSGGVELEQNLDADHESDLCDVSSYLSVYASFAHVQAPWVYDTQPITQYFHGGSCALPPEDQLGGLVDQLAKQNLLPNSRFCRRRLALTAGTWQEASMGAGN